MKRIAIRRFPIQAVLVWAAALVVVPMPFTAIPWATLGPMYRSMLTPITAGIYAYIWMLECVWLGCRPRWLDRIIGLPGIYVLHGVLGTGALALVVYHKYNGRDRVLDVGRHCRARTRHDGRLARYAGSAARHRAQLARTRVPP